MQGQGAIIGVGSMEYPPEFQGSDPDKLSDMSVAKVMTLTSTYDHRVIQGAQSGQYLARLHAPAARRGRLLRRRLRGASDPVRADPLGAGRQHRPRGPDPQAGPDHGDDQRLPGPRAPDGRHRPAGVSAAAPPRSRRADPRVDPVGPRPGVRHRLLRGRPGPDEDAQDPGHPARFLLPHHRHRVHAHPGADAAEVDPGSGRAPARVAARARSTCGSWTSSTRPRSSRRSCRPSSSGRSASAWRAGSPPSRCWTRSASRPPTSAWKRSASACRTAAG